MPGTPSPKFSKILATSGCDNTDQELNHDSMSKECNTLNSRDIISKHQASENNIARPSDLQIVPVVAKSLFISNEPGAEGGGSDSISYHLPPPSRGSSGSPVALRRLSATSVASRASQNRLSGGSFKGSRSKINQIERKNP